MVVSSIRDRSSSARIYRTRTAETLFRFWLCVPAFCICSAAVAQTMPEATVIDDEVNRIMTATHANGMAVAVIDHGKVVYVNAFGVRNAKGDPLATDAVMYGASLTKTVF